MTSLRTSASGSPYERAIHRAQQRAASWVGGATLHPSLRSYFAAVPEGHVGRGTGTFDCVGTPRRWLHPMLRVLEQRGVVRAVWSRNVPFTVENRTIDGRAVSRRTFLLPGGTWTMSDSVGLNRSGRLVDELGDPVSIVVSFDVDVDVDVRGAGAGADDRGDWGHRKGGGGGASANGERGGLRLTSRAVGVRIDGLFGSPSNERGSGHLPPRLSAILNRARDRMLRGRMLRGRVVRLPRLIAPTVRLHERFDAETNRQRVNVTIDLPVIGRVYEYGGTFTYRIEEDS